MCVLIESEVISLDAAKFAHTTANYQDALAFCRAQGKVILLAMRENEDACWDVPVQFIHPENFQRDSFVKDMEKLNSIDPYNKKTAFWVLDSEPGKIRK